MYRLKRLLPNLKEFSCQWDLLPVCLMIESMTSFFIWKQLFREEAALRKSIMPFNGVEEEQIIALSLCHLCLSGSLIHQICTRILISASSWLVCKIMYYCIVSSCNNRKSHTTITTAWAQAMIWLHRLSTCGSTQKKWKGLHMLHIDWIFT